MGRSVIFTDEQHKQSVRDWYDRFRAALEVPTEERRVDTSFGHTHLLVAGPEGAEPLVVTHGALASSAHVLHELGHLVASRRIYAIDVIGQSVMSEDRRIELDGDDYGRWLVEVVDALGLERFDLVGASWGGFVAMRAASVLGERVRRLALIVPAGFVSGPAWAGFTKMGWPIMMYRAFPSEARLEALLRELFTEADPLWARYFGDALRAYKLDMRIPPLLRREQAAKLAAPVLVVAAEDDLSFPGGALLERAKELLPEVEVELVAGAKHSPPMTPAFRSWLASRLERFFETHPR